MNSRVRALVQVGLSSLGEIQREIILLFHQQSWSISDIARYLQMPEGTVKSHLHRARRKMRETIERSKAIDDAISEVFR
jgi:RNA polymerase sigma-70 factor (ECF subfamily)